MKCRLCDRPSAAGKGKLCTDCAKALQRARGQSWSKLGPSTSTAAEAAVAPPIALTLAPSAPTPRSNRTLFWVGIGVSVLAAVYLARSDLTSSGFAVEPGRAPPTTTKSVNDEAAPAITRVEEPSWTIPDASQPSPVGDAMQTPVAATSAKAVAPASDKPAKAAKTPARDTAPMPVPLASESDAAAPKAVETEPHPPLAAVKVAAPAPPADGAQALANAMQKCSSEGLFSKFICEQKTYLQYCEDKWDKDPKCMRKVGER